MQPAWSGARPAPVSGEDAALRRTLLFRQLEASLLPSRNQLITASGLTGARPYCARGCIFPALPPTLSTLALRRRQHHLSAAVAALWGAMYSRQQVWT